MQKPFQGFSTLFKTPINDNERQIGVIGIPFDGAQSYRTGARFGPNAIRSASMMLTDGEHPYLGLDPASFVTDLGDVPVSNVDVAKSLEQITERVHEAMNWFVARDPSRKLMFMGGDHTVTLGVLRAFATYHEDLFVLHLDAHADTWADHFGDPIGHGTWVRNVVDEGLIKPWNIMSVGLRSPIDRETKHWLSSRGGKAISARTARQIDPLALANDIIRSANGRPVYVSLDIDVLDPAYAPGTGTPEIGGFTTAFVDELLHTLLRCNIVGADVVEVSPAYDQSEITALAAASFLSTLACVMKLKS